MESLTDIEMGDAAHTAVKKNMVQLIRGINVGDIPFFLYQEEFLSQETWELFSKTTVTDRTKGNAMVRDVQERVQVCPSMLQTLCQILSQETATKEIAGIIYATYEKQRKEKATQVSNRLLKDLIAELEMFKVISQRQVSPDNLEELIQKSIQHYLHTSLEERIPVESIKKDLNNLYQKEMLISREIWHWATTECEKAVKIQPGMCTTLALPTTTPQQPPSLFSPNTLYHASLCSLAISKYRDEKSIHRFFDENDHKLCEVSVCQENSSEKLDRYLIARNGDIIYIAFRSEGKFSEWLNKYNTFEMGIEKQTDNIPVYFFLEQMLKQQKVILTGFSFGGMLACSVAAKLWSIALDPNLLQRNLCCITFGQPIIKIPYVQKMASNFPKLEETIHLVLNKEDFIPGLMHYHGVGCILKGVSQAKNEAKQLESSVNEETEITNFRGPFSSKFLQSLCILQDMNENKSDGRQSLSTLKTLLKGMKFKEDTCGLIGKIHMMRRIGESGLVWKSQVPKKDAVELLLNLETYLIQKIDTTLFKEHKMESYRTNTCQTFLNKYHSDKIPSPSSSPQRVQSVSILSPEIHSVEFHLYPDLHVVVLLGNNLWFCHKIKLGIKGVTIESPANVKRRSVQYDFPPSTKTEALANNGIVRVIVQSHFAHPVQDDIPTKQEPFFFTLRQKQLAKHTPTKLIQLAYYTAMLERPLLSSASSGDTPLMSKRFEAVKYYLEEAAKIVPLESVLFAIAYGDDDTALQCTRALQSSGLSFPLSQMMITGLGMAAERVCHGSEYQKQAAEVRNYFLQPAFVSEQRTSFSLQSQSQPNFPSEPFAFPRSIAPSQRAFHERQTYFDEVEAQYKAKVMSCPRFVQMTVPIPVPILTTPPTPLDHYAAIYMSKLFAETINKYNKQRSIPILSTKSIEHFCPFSCSRITLLDSKLKSPVQALKEARIQLESLVEELNNPSMRDVQNAIEINQKVLDKVRSIQQNVVKICASLLAAFMEQQIQIPLLSTDIGTAKALSATSPVAMGAWAFVSMNLGDIQEVLSSPEGQSLSFIIEVEDYINSILHLNSNEKSKPKKGRRAKDSAYASKLGFLVSGIKTGPTVTCSTQYISYSLECQLKKLSEQLKFDNKLSVNKLVESWESTFKGNALSLVAKTHRPLIGRWLKWALLTHDLRDAIASYLCLGVIGISNSGKSLLVNNLFKTKAQVGSTQSKKTVVPFLYNLDGKVDNLDVVDFPGIDDKDSIPELANILVSLAQVVICVVNYKSVSSDSLTEWLSRLDKEDIPVLVCLTHADLLCDDLREELKTEGGDYPSLDTLKLRIELEQKVTTDVLCSHHVPSRTLRYCCFNKQSSHLSLEELTSVGVHTFKDVGMWLVTTIRDKLDQPEIATKLREFLETKDIID